MAVGMNAGCASASDAFCASVRAALHDSHVFHEPALAGAQGRHPRAGDERHRGELVVFRECNSAPELGHSTRGLLLVLSGERRHAWLCRLG